ncbi:hypothetical protein B0H11DRAFT_1931281 [Mycena galericulata]|nr:hypothetical protein B0H11DRAFT_1931281 [Mycena galericulata]
MSYHGPDSLKIYTVLGGESPGVVSTAPFLGDKQPSPILPIIIKCTSHPEANAAFGLQNLFKRFGHDKAEQQPEDFAREISASRQILDLFAASGPFYAVYKGKGSRAIYVKNYPQDQVHGVVSPKFQRFESIKDALVYMVLRGDKSRMVQLGLYSGKW